MSIHLYRHCPKCLFERRSTMIKREIVPRRPVHCMESMLIHLCSYTEYHSLNSFLNEFSYDQVLHTVCKEKNNYSDALKQYNHSCNHMIDSELFVVSYKVHEKYNIKIIGEDITIFYFQSRIKIGNENLFPWDYAHSINVLGNRCGYTEEEILNDFLNINFFQYYFKYYLNTEKTIGSPAIAITKKNDVYTVCGEIQVIIDSHITVCHNKKPRMYVADTWWYDNDEIITDMCNMPIIQFGEKYKAFWCS